jgi:CRP-like cAMP-binding protein
MSNSIEQYQDIFAYFEQFVSFSDEEKIGFSSLLNTKKYKKGETITAIDSVEQHLTFVSSGIVRGYYLKGVDNFTYFIGFSNAFVSAFSSFTNQTPSEVGLEAMTDVTVYQMRYSDLQILYNSSKEGERMGRFAAEQMCSVYETRLMDLLTKSAMDRYEELVVNEPRLILTIPQKYVAEYLGIQPESLSRLKKQVMIKGTNR